MTREEKLAEIQRSSDEDLTVPWRSHVSYLLTELRAADEKIKELSDACRLMTDNRDVAIPIERLQSERMAALLYQKLAVAREALVYCKEMMQAELRPEVISIKGDDQYYHVVIRATLNTVRQALERIK